MMFPIEILEVIFSHLQQHDKAECMLVCHHWNAVIKQGVLYHTLLIETEQSLDAIVWKIKNNLDIGKKVERLVVGFTDHTLRAALSELLTLLSNVEVLHYFCYASSFKEVRYPWKNNIKELVDYSRYGPTCDIISCGESLNITTLDVHFREDFIGLFRNMPFLTNLHFTLFEASLNQLEALHDYLPQLKSFSVQRSEFRDVDLFDKDNVKPAFSVTECSFRVKVHAKTNRLEANLNLLKYMCKKYPNLSTLSFNIIQGSSIYSRDLNILHEYGWLPLLNSLGSSLKKLYINEAAYIDGVFEILDQSNCQINRVELDHIRLGPLMNIVNSLQTNYIQAFEIKLTKALIHEGFTWLKKFRVLVKLKLSGKDNGIDIKLNDIIDNFPSSLKTLSFRSICFTADLDCTNSCNIETLSLHSVILRKHVDTFISQYFQKLFKLKLKYCYLPESTLDLANLDITNFYFADTSNSTYTTILTTCNGEQRFYTYRNEHIRKMSYKLSIISHPRLLYIPYKSWTNRKTKPDFTLSCNSIRQVTFTV